MVACPRVAVMGAGRWGRNLVRVFAGMTEADLAFIVDTDPDVLAEMGALYPKTPSASDIASVVGEVDAVAVATPTWDHAEHARYLLRAGRHVLVEKPMASSGAEARELASMASERDAVLAVGHQLLYHPAFESLTLAVAEGSVGEIVGIEAVRTGLVDLGKEPDALWALGPHDIAMILALVGEAPAVRDARAHRSRDRGAIDAVEIDLDLPRGARAAVTLDGRTSERRRRFEVVGSLGRLAFDDGDSGPWLSIAGPDGEERRLAIDAREPLAAECRHFVECASGRSAPRAGGDHGALVASVLERISLAVE